MILKRDSQIRAMRTTSVQTRGHSRSASVLRRNTGQGRTAQDADSPTVASVDQRKFQKGKHKIRPIKHTLTRNADRDTGRNHRVSEGQSEINQAKSRLWP